MIFLYNSTSLFLSKTVKQSIISFIRLFSVRFWRASVYYYTN